MSENFKNFSHKETAPSVAEDLKTAVGLLRDVLKDAQTDRLTGVDNRGGLEKELDTYFRKGGDPVEEFLVRMKGVDAHRETQRSAEHIGKGSVILLDIDYFKKINDGYGHAAGDVVLKTFAHVVKKVIRKDDILARYGGEEFLILCPNTDEHGAEILAEKIRAAVEKEAILLQQQTNPLHITLSAGVAQIRESIIVDGEHVEPQPQEVLQETTKEMVNEAIVKADAALYAAKEEGRNRVRVDSDMGRDLHYTDKAA